VAELENILDSGDIESLILSPSTKTYNEGQLFYDDTAKTLSFHNNIPDVTLNIGQEVVLKVNNNTGADIPNGAAVSFNGAGSGVPYVKLAIADSIVNASILGIATHTIVDGSDGLITVNGTIGLDTTSYTPGTILYLSPTLPGEYTDVIPDIISQVGTALDATTGGKLQVKVNSNIVLPTTLSFLQGQTVPTYTNMGNGVNIINYASVANFVMEGDITLGTINTKFAGAYRATFSWAGTVSTDDSTIYWDLYDETNANIIYTFTNQIPNNASTTELSASFSIPFNVLTADVVVRIRARSTDANQDLTIDSTSFDIESIRISL